MEFALITLPLLLLIFGVITFGYGYFAQQGANSAAREGARLAAVGVNSCGSWPSPAANSWRGHVKGAATGVADLDAPTVKITEAGLDSADAASIGTGDQAEVTIPYHVPLTLLSIVPGFPDKLDLTAKASARVESLGSATSLTTGDTC
ncbi:MAG: pilus assembly protein [Actinomycetota bacterium]|nr:pilus assembly protein [Actinomycetota bacterium]